MEADRLVILGLQNNPKDKYVIVKIVRGPIQFKIIPGRITLKLVQTNVKKQIYPKIYVQIHSFIYERLYFDVEIE